MLVCVPSTQAKKRKHSFDFIYLTAAAAFLIKSRRWPARAKKMK